MCSKCSMSREGKKKLNTKPQKKKKKKKKKPFNFGCIFQSRTV